MTQPFGATRERPRFLANPAIGKVAAALAVYEGVTSFYDRSRNFVTSNLLYTVSVSETDDIYPTVHEWLLSVLPARRQKALVASTEHRRRGPHPAASDPNSEAPDLRLLYNDERARPVEVAGHRLLVQIQEAHTEGHASSVNEATLKPAKVVFGARTHAGQQALIDELRRLHAERLVARRPRLRMVNNWGSWNARDDLPPRSLASVALPPEQKARVVDDLRRFLAAEEHYNRLAVPWHRGYMFHGPPGTGKTSLVRALASEFNLDLWYVSLSDLKAESGLMSLLAEVSPRSMLLLEDIDTIEISHERDTSQGSISMSSLLNALDGVATPHGLVTVMTTNHFHKLDPALTRPGRMDIVEELAPLTPATLSDLFRHYYDRPLEDPTVAAAGVSAAVVAEIFKRHLQDPAAAVGALRALSSVREGVGQ